MAGEEGAAAATGKPERMAVGGPAAGRAVAEMVVAGGGAKVRAEGLVEAERAVKEEMVMEGAAKGRAVTLTYFDGRRVATQ